MDLAKQLAEVTLDAGGSSTMGLAEQIAEQEAVLDGALEYEAFSFLSRIDQIENKKPRSKERHPAACAGSSRARTQTPKSPSEPLGSGSGSGKPGSPQAVQKKGKEVYAVISDSHDRNQDASKLSASEFHEKSMFLRGSDVAMISIEEERIASIDASVIGKLLRILEKIKRMMFICEMDKKHMREQNHILISEQREWQHGRELFESQIGSHAVDKQIQKLRRTLYWSLILIKKLNTNEAEMAKRTLGLESEAEKLQLQCKQIHHHDQKGSKEEVLVNLLETLRFANHFLSDYDEAIKGMFDEICKR